MKGRFSAPRKPPSRLFTAVPIAKNSMTFALHVCRLKSRRTATTPSAPSASASSSRRVIASSRALYIACVSVVSSSFTAERIDCAPIW